MYNPLSSDSSICNTCRTVARSRPRLISGAPNSSTLWSTASGEGVGLVYRRPPTATANVVRGGGGRHMFAHTIKRLLIGNSHNNICRNCAQLGRIFTVYSLYKSFPRCDADEFVQKPRERESTAYILNANVLLSLCERIVCDLNALHINLVWYLFFFFFLPLCKAWEHQDGIMFL